MSLVTWNGRLLLSPNGKLTLGPAADVCCCVGEGCGCDNLPETLYGRLRFDGLGVTWDFEPFTLNLHTTEPTYDPPCPGASVIPLADRYYYTDGIVDWIRPAPPGFFPTAFCRIFLYCNKLSDTEVLWKAYGFANDHVYWDSLFSGCEATLPLEGFDNSHYYYLEISDTPF